MLWGLMGYAQTVGREATLQPVQKAPSDWSAELRVLPVLPADTIRVATPSALPPQEPPRSTSPSTKETPTKPEEL